MEAGSKTRARGVALTPEAIESLNRAAAATWLKENPDLKMTRLAKAEMLGISEATLARMVAGKKVDRYLIELAFARVGLNWADESKPKPSDSTRDFQPVPQPVRSLESRTILIGLAVLTMIPIGWVGYANYTVNSGDVFKANFQAMQEVCHQSYEAGNYLYALKEMKRLDQEAESRGMTGLEAEGLALEADAYAALGNLEEAESCYRKVLRYRTEHKESIRIPPIKDSLGVLLTRMKRYPEATQMLNEALAVFKSERDAVGEAMALRDLGTVAYETDELPIAITKFDLAKSTVVILPHQEAIIRDIEARRSLVQARQGDLAGALKQLNECLTYWKANDHPRWIALTQYQLALVNFEANQYSEARALVTQSSQGYENTHDQLGEQNARELLLRIESRVGQKVK